MEAEKHSSDSSGKKKDFKVHVSESKKKIVKDLANLMKKKSIVVVSIKNLPSAQFQEIKKKIRSMAVIQVAKKNLIDFALDHSGVKELHALVPYVQDSTALLFSDSDAFEISAFLSENKTPARAKEGQIAPENIIVKAGGTDLVPGPDITALSAVGLRPQVKEGKIHIMLDSVLCKKDEVITSAKASILAKLGISPFKVGLEPIAAFMDGKVYADVKVDKEVMIKELENFYAKGIAFAVSLNYFTKESLPFILGKAAAHESAISALIKTESANANVVENAPIASSN